MLSPRYHDCCSPTAVKPPMLELAEINFIVISTPKLNQAAENDRDRNVADICKIDVNNLLTFTHTNHHKQQLE